MVCTPANNDSLAGVDRFFRNPKQAASVYSLHAERVNCLLIRLQRIKALKPMAKEFGRLSRAQIDEAIASAEFVEVQDEDEKDDKT